MRTALLVLLLATACTPPREDVGQRIERECRELVAALIRNQAGRPDVDTETRVRACVFQKAGREGAQ